jgi:prophage regulatory protein
MATIRKSSSKLIPHLQSNSQTQSRTAVHKNLEGAMQASCEAPPVIDWRSHPLWEANEQLMWAAREGMDTDALENEWACQQEVDAETLQEAWEAHEKIAGTPYVPAPNIPTAASMLTSPEVRKRRGRGRSAHYDDIKKGLFIEPVAIGLRSRATPDYEVDTLIAASIAGKTEEEIRALVIKLRVARKGAL